MKKFAITFTGLMLTALAATAVWAQTPQTPKYPPLSEYMMEPDAEVALARSVAPESISAARP
jgi:hypothetical protein